MANNDWRIAGGLGTEQPADPDQNYLTQGIGFPLRPVDGVPLTDEPTIPDGVVAEGLFMQWMGTWSQGLYYPKGAYVRSGAYTSVANKLTLDYPAPIASAPAEFAMPTPWAGATLQNVPSIIEGRHLFTFSEGGWIKSIRIWVPTVTGDYTFQITVLDRTDPNNIISTQIPNPNTAAGAWALAAALNAVVRDGDILEFILSTGNSAASTQFSGQWIYTGTTPTNPPGAEDWNQNNQSTVLRVDKNDTSGTDRSAELLSVVPGSTLIATDLNTPLLTSTYQIITITDQGSYVGYDVSLIGATGGGPNPGNTTLEFTLPTAAGADYDDEASFWAGNQPSWAAIESSLWYDGVNQAAPNDTAYGIDIEFEAAVVSDDWDIVTIDT